MKSYYNFNPKGIKIILFENFHEFLILMGTIIASGIFLIKVFRPDR